MLGSTSLHIPRRRLSTTFCRRRLRSYMALQLVCLTRFIHSSCSIPILPALPTKKLFDLVWWSELVVQIACADLLTVFYFNLAAFICSFLSFVVAAGTAFEGKGRLCSNRSAAAGGYSSLYFCGLHYQHLSLPAEPVSKLSSETTHKRMVQLENTSFN